MVIIKLDGFIKMYSYDTYSKLHNEELHNFYCSYKIRIMKQEHEMVRACNIHGRVQKCIQGCGRKAPKRALGRPPSNENSRRLDASGFTTTTLPHTQHCQFVNYWRKSEFLCFRRVLTLQISHIVTKIKIENQGLSFQSPDSVHKSVTDAIRTQEKTTSSPAYEAWKIHCTM